MLLEADFVGVVGVGFVAVNGLGAVGIFNGGFLLVGIVLCGGGSAGDAVGRHGAEWGGGAVAAICAGRAAGVARDGGRGLEAAELGGRVHLRGLVVDLGFGTVGVAVGDGARGARAGVFLVQSVRIDKGAVAGLGLRAVVEDPHNLGWLALGRKDRMGRWLTATMDRRM